MPENSAIYPNCGMHQMHTDSEGSAEDSLRIISEKYPQTKDDDISSLRNKVEAAFQEKGINENQKESLLMIIDAMGSLKMGQQLILTSLITELTAKVDVARQRESARLLRRYLKTLEMQEDVIDKLSLAFGPQ